MRDKPATPTDGSFTNVAVNAVTPSQSTGLIAADVIRLRAYQKWEAAGKPAGDGVQFWLAAEKELARQRTRRWWTHIQPWIVPRRLHFFRRESEQRL